jgi:hypothetical protein
MRVRPATTADVDGITQLMRMYVHRRQDTLEKLL